MPHVFIMRGVPGSGKSWNVQKLVDKYPDAVVCSADQYFIDKDGTYRFDVNKLGAAHNSCQSKFREALDISREVVIVDNTNTQWREIAPYAEYAKACGYTINIVESNTPWAFNAAQCAKKNSHGVPYDAICRMLNRFEATETIIKKIEAL